MLILLSVALLRAPARAQVVPSAYGPEQSLWVGAEYSNVLASFPYQSMQRLSGVGAFVELRLNRRIGLEADTRFLRFGGFENSTESSYLAGPKFYLFPRKKFQPYAKLLAGVGNIHYPFAIGDASYFALAPRSTGSTAAGCCAPSMSTRCGLTRLAMRMSPGMS
jgi:hypothetical protein